LKRVNLNSPRQRKREVAGAKKQREERQGKPSTPGFEGEEEVKETLQGGASGRKERMEEFLERCRVKKSKSSENRLGQGKTKLDARYIIRGAVGRVGG